MIHKFYDETVYKMGTSRVDIQTGPFTLFNLFLSQPFLLPLSSFIFFLNLEIWRLDITILEHHLVTLENTWSELGSGIVGRTRSWR